MTPNVVQIVQSALTPEVTAGAAERLGEQPGAVAAALAAATGWLPVAPLTREEVRLLRTDKVAGELPTPARLGIAARPLRAGLPDALRAGR